MIFENIIIHFFCAVQDLFRHKGQRRKLIDALEAKGITDQRVLSAMMKIPRHFFMDTAFENFAYQDKAFPIGSEQTISHPYTVAFQSQLLEVKPGEKILEIGTGSAYQTCVLVELGAKVFSIERHRSLHMKSKQLMEGLGFRAKLFFGDGYIGKAAYAPFDKIIITAAAPYVPEDLKTQLCVGGWMVIPHGEGENQTMLKLTKISDTEFKTEEFGEFSFVPMLKDKSFKS